jgi:methionyl aminopeptidase
VGEISDEVRELLDTTRACLDLALNEVRAGVRWSSVAAKMQKLAESHGYGVVREFVGHGIGREMHEDPKVPNYWDSQQPDGDFELAVGMTLAIEPMLTMGRPAVEFGDASRWPVVTKDRACAAHFEHTIAVVNGGVSVLTGVDRA